MFNVGIAVTRTVHSPVSVSIGLDTLGYLLQLPGRRSYGSSGWKMQAQVTFMAWIGLSSERQSITESLPPGYQSVSVTESTLSLNVNLPMQLLYSGTVSCHSVREEGALPDTCLHLALRYRAAYIPAQGPCVSGESDHSVGFQRSL